MKKLAAVAIKPEICELQQRTCNILSHITHTLLFGIAEDVRGDDNVNCVFMYWTGAGVGGGGIEHTVGHYYMEGRAKR